jgi:hypothetical protein
MGEEDEAAGVNCGDGGSMGHNGGGMRHGEAASSGGSMRHVDAACGMNT